jgi:hypothetical protein
VLKLDKLSNATCFHIEPEVLTIASSLACFKAVGVAVATVSGLWNCSTGESGMPGTHSNVLAQPIYRAVFLAAPFSDRGPFQVLVNKGKYQARLPRNLSTSPISAPSSERAMRS